MASLEFIKVRRFDWHRIRKNIGDLKSRLASPATDATTWAAAAWSAAITSGLALVPIITATDRNSAVIVVFCVTAVAAGVMGWLCLLFGKDARRSRDNQIDAVCAEMDLIEEHLPSAITFLASRADSAQSLAQSASGESNTELIATHQPRVLDPPVNRSFGTRDATFGDA